MRAGHSGKTDMVSPQEAPDREGRALLRRAEFLKKMKRLSNKGKVWTSRWHSYGAII